MSIAAGDVVDGRYRVIRALAEGGMGVVYEAEHTGLQKRVALKVLRTEIADTPGVAARFEREARATSKLDHPRIVRVTDFGRASQGLYLVLELLAGRPLSALLDEHEQLPIARALSIADQILEGLGAAHAQGLVHRDLKPDNVFLCTAAGELDDVKVLDFGIAVVRSDAQATKLTQTGSIVGTPAYMAPEQAMGRKDLDARTDLHAAGALLYEMLTGRPPYEAANYNLVIHAILIGDPPPLASLRPDVPAHVATAVMRSLATNPAERPASAEAMRALLRGPEWKLPDAIAVTDLGGKRAAPAIAAAARAPTEPRVLAPEPRVLAPEPVAALELDRPPPPPPVEIAAPTPRNGRWLIALGAVLALVGAGLGARQLLAPKDAIIDLDGAADALVLDGTTITGRRLQLPISEETHVLVVRRRGEAPRTIRFRASGDRHLDLASGAP